MLELSKSDFMRTIVSQIDTNMYSVWVDMADAGRRQWDMNGVLNIVISAMFVSNMTGSLVDDVRNIARHRREGALFWIP